MAKIKYKSGDRIGPDNILFVKRTKKIKNLWCGIFKCPICGSEFETKIGYVQQGKTKHCKNCSSRIKEEKKNDIVGMRFKSFVVLERTDTRAVKNKEAKSYLHSAFMYKCLCDCGDFFYTTKTKIKSGKINYCPKCTRLNVDGDLSGKRFGKLMVIKDSGERDSDSSNNQRRLWLCKCDCGNYRLVSTYNLRKGYVKSCGCLKSKGEEKIAQVLKKTNIRFKTQKKFQNCKNINFNIPYRFDFYLLDYNICLEYDGEQHFKYTNRGWDTEEQFKKTQKRDNIKNQYCKEHNIKLIRIPYWDYDRLNKEYLQKALQCPLMDLSKTF